MGYGQPSRHRRIQSVTPCLIGGTGYESTRRRKVASVKPFHVSVGRVLSAMV